MSRFSRNSIVINNGEASWDSKVNTGTLHTFDRPFPVHEHAGDESDLEATYPAASYDRCLVWVDHTTLGWILFVSNGTSWVQFSGSNVRSSSDATINATAADDYIIVTGAGGNTVTLPAVASLPIGKKITIKNSTAGNVTVNPDGSETIDGALTAVSFTQYESFTLLNDGTEWHQV